MNTELFKKINSAAHKQTDPQTRNLIASIEDSFIRNNHLTSAEIKFIEQVIENDKLPEGRGVKSLRDEQNFYNQ